MWTVENRGSYDRGGLRYPSDVTDDEWAHIAPLIPPAKRGGRKRNVDVRDVVNGLMYILSTGCQWRAIPKDLPPRSTLFGYFELWDYEGTPDGGYQGPVFDHPRKKILPHLETEIVKRCDTAVGFEVIPRRWVVERTFAWLGRCRRLAKDFENRTRTARAFLLLASIRLMLRKLCLNT